ncbi:MAG: anti-sigma factor [Caldilineaceae bacterium]
MHSDMAAPDVDSLIAAYAIGATDVEEAAWVQSQLSANPAAAQELAQYQVLADQLLHSAPAVEPPAALAQQLAAAIEAEAAGPSAQHAGALSRPMAGQNSRNQPGAPPRTWFFGSRPRFALSRFQIAAVALLALLVVSNIVSLTKIRSLQAVQEKLWRQISTEQLTQLSIAQVILATYPTTSFEVAADGGARAYVEWCPQTYTVLVEAGDFPVLSPDMTYQLWLIRDGQRTSGGLFTVNPWGNGTLVMQLDEPLDQYDAIGITPEPAGGSSGPTAPPVVRKEF